MVKVSCAGSGFALHGERSGSRQQRRPDPALYPSIARDVTARTRKGRVGQSIEHVADLALEAAEHARLGLTNARRRHLKLAGQGNRRAALDDSQPEGLPGAFLELAAHLLQRPAIKLADLLGFLG